MSKDAGGHDFQTDLDALKRDLAALRDSVARAASSAAGEAARTLHDKASDAASQAGAAAGGFADQGRDFAENAKGQALGLAAELEALARRNPLGTIGGAVFVGFVLGLMSRGRG